MWPTENLNPHHPGPGHDDLEGGVLAVGVAGGVIFFRGAEGRVFHEPVIGEEDQQGPRGKFPEPEEEIDLEVRDHIGKEVGEGAFFRVDLFIDPADLPKGIRVQRPSCRCKGLFKTGDLGCRTGGLVGPDRAFSYKPKEVGHGPEKFRSDAFPKIPAHAVHEEVADPLVVGDIALF